jgi:hypothetical protein
MLRRNLCVRAALVSSVLLVGACGADSDGGASLGGAQSLPLANAPAIHVELDQTVSGAFSVGDCSIPHGHWICTATNSSSSPLNAQDIQAVYSCYDASGVKVGNGYVIASLDPNGRSRIDLIGCGDDASRVVIKSELPAPQ